MLDESPVLLAQGSLVLHELDGALGVGLRGVAPADAFDLLRVQLHLSAG